MVLQREVIGASRCFKELIRVIYDDIWLTEKLRGDGGIVSSTLPGNHGHGPRWIGENREALRTSPRRRHEGIEGGGRRDSLSRSP